MSIAHKIGSIIVVSAFLSVYLRNIRRTADYDLGLDPRSLFAEGVITGTVKWDHVTAAYFIVYAGFTFASGLGILYNIILSWPLGWLLGLRWARMRIKHLKSVPVAPDASAREDSARLQVASEQHIPMKVTIPPLPLVLDCLIAVGCAALGVLLGLGVRAIVELG